MDFRLIKHVVTCNIIYMESAVLSRKGRTARSLLCLLCNLLTVPFLWGIFSLPPGDMSRQTLVFTKWLAFMGKLRFVFAQWILK
ncbi:hypothetical protein A6P56_29680 (plasmid) [Klebsiella pneumoniae]|nr:hypothetical protein A6P56_29680 [Klebsiella pneumoniae]HBY1206018.1 hypothetical protein [Klebsiella pneumoniae]